MKKHDIDLRSNETELKDIEIDLLLEIHKNMPRQGAGRNKYTEKAYNMIPKIEKPNILDIGCGPGMQTIKLAKISYGRVIGIDIFDQYLDQLRELIKKEHLENKVEALNQSMFDIKFPEKYFDIIWAEGSIFIIGFEKGLIKWKKYIKEKGYLAVHDLAWIRKNPPREIRDFFNKTYPAMKTVEENLELIKKSGYNVLGNFALPEDAWWEFYYDPLQKRLNRLKEKYQNNKKAMEFINKEQLEIDLYKKYSKYYSSVFYVIQKK